MIELGFTEEEMCHQLMEELEQLTDKEWEMLETTNSENCCLL